MAAGGVLTPVVAWAQRKDVLLLTIKISGITNPDIKVLFNRYPAPSLS
jgi:hypothetical protein